METKIYLESPNLTMGEINDVIKKLGGEEGTRKFLREELIIQPVVISELPSEDSIIHVDRSKKPICYPDWKKKLKDPEFECSGPIEYDLTTDVEQFIHSDKYKREFFVSDMYHQLKKNNVLALCLNLQDGVAIQAMGITVFKRVFGMNSVYLFASGIKRTDGQSFVPYLYPDGDRVGQLWSWLHSPWISGNIILHFKKN